MEPAPDEHAVDAPHRPAVHLRRLLRHVVPYMTAGLLALIAFGAVGRLARDRNVILALMMYIPMLPVGLWAVGQDTACRGRCIPRFRFGLAILGLVAAAWGTSPLLGLRRPDPAPPGAVEVSLLHWNVMSGGRHAALPRWESAAEEILQRQPDLIVLSEAPPDGWTLRTLRGHGPRGWRAVHIRHEDGSPYWYKPAVFSRSPLRHERVPVRNGAAMAVATDVKGRTVRLLVVDGVSTPTVPRAPLLHDIAAACDKAAARGQPYDVIVGDFNVVSASIGFDDVMASGGGYRPAAAYCGGWRGTWPLPLPVYDIDHALVRRGLPVVGAELFSSPRLASDHRGQFVRLVLPPGQR